MKQPTGRDDLLARCAALLRKSTRLRWAASLLVGKSRGERAQAQSQVVEIKPLLEPPAPE